jgi:hypothetical protein
MKREMDLSRVTFYAFPGRVTVSSFLEFSESVSRVFKNVDGGLDSRRLNHCVARDEHRILIVCIFTS